MVPDRPARATVIALWKPYGHVSQWERKGDHPGVGELLARRSASSAPDGVGPGVRCVGRLDHDTEGLLLLTDDGGLLHRLTDPRFAHRRTYWAQVERVPDEAALEALRRGPRLGDGPTRPCEARALGEPPLPPRPVPIRERKAIPTGWVELVLTEGRNRQVRRMTAAVGHPTLRLVRWAVGPLTLERLGLSPGGWRRLEPAEVDLLGGGGSNPPARLRSGRGRRR